MAKNQVPEERNGTSKKTSPEKRNITSKKNSITQNKSNPKTKNSTKNENKKEDKSRNEIRKKANNDARSKEIEFLVVPSSSMESENDDVVELEVERGSSNDEVEEEDEKETLKSMMEKGKTNILKKKGKKRSREEDDDEEDESDAENKGENTLYRFPMNRVSRIIKSDKPDIKITQEAVFVINRASEKFLQLFCREAYAYAFLDGKKYTAYEHLSTLVSRRKQLNFLSDIVPEKVKAEDAVAQISEAEKKVP